MHFFVLTKFFIHLILALAFFAIVFVATSIALKGQGAGSSGISNLIFGVTVDNRTAKILSEIQGTSILMAVAYLFGSTGAYLRQAMEFIGASRAATDSPDMNLVEVRYSEGGTILRAAIGGIFGVISVLAIDSGLVAKLIFEGSGQQTDIEPTFAGIAIVSFFVGTFGGEAFMAAKSRIQVIAATVATSSPGTPDPEKNATDAKVAVQVENRD